jgi:hypothetical protein
MKSVKISHDIKYAIADYDDGSYDDNVNKLIDEVEDYMPLINLLDDSSVIINLKKDTVDRINAFKLTNSESIYNVLVRMFIVSQALNSGDE